MSNPENPDIELSDDIVTALRAVSPASDAVREAHLATALREIAPRSRRRISPISVAASIILVLAVGTTLFARTGKNATPVLAAHSITAYVATKGANAADFDRELGINSCQFGNNQIFGVYLMDTQPMKLAWQDKNISVMNGDSCDTVAVLKRPVGRAPLPKGEKKACTVAPTEETTFLAETSSSGYMYQVHATNTELMLYDCATHAVIERIAHPNPEVSVYP